ncbi:MAG TPA: Flp family type IVb pilin [Methyloceanibacter sp.]|nr:Flp family type IVb pilin [Methyloceanibacter sp.]
MRTLFARFAKDESGATAIEYGLIAAGIAVAISVVVFSVGDALVAMFENVASKLQPPA